MNRYQKLAWFGLVVPCFPVAWYFIVGIFSNSVFSISTLIQYGKGGGGYE